MIGYLEGSFPHEQIKSTHMKSWFGQAADRRGKAFTQDVGARLHDLGWNVECEVPVTKILRMRLEVDYGDVDVLAWSEARGRILFAECKDLHFHKTPGEIAEQLSASTYGRCDTITTGLHTCYLSAVQLSPHT